MKTATPNQVKRRARATAAKGVLQSEEIRGLFADAERAAVQAVRDAETPEEAWQARAGLLAHDGLLKVLALATQDLKMVQHEVDMAAKAEKTRDSEQLSAKWEAEYSLEAEKAREAVLGGS